MRNYRNSKQLFERAKKALAGGVSSQFRAGEKPHPLFFRRGRGAHIWDEDGNRFLDFTLSQGPLFLGHSCPEVIQAVSEAIQQAQLYSAQHEAELELAEKLVQIIHGAELVRFSLSGSEAVHAALRLARAFTGRKKVIKFEGHYHGWYDDIAFSINPSRRLLDNNQNSCPIPWSAGQPDQNPDLLVLPWNDVEVLDSVFRNSGSEIAAIIAEPIMCNNGCIGPGEGYLEHMRSLCDRNGSLLIFDEVITGFRVSLGGAQELLNIVPDLSIFGKAMGSGFPISALCGKAEVMEPIASGQVIHAGTLNGNVTSVAAALATITKLEKESPALYQDLSKKGCRLMGQIRELGRKTGFSVLVQGPGPMFYLAFSSLAKCENYRDCLASDSETYGRFVLEMKERGIRLIGRGLWYLSPSHSEADMEECLEGMRHSLAAIASTVRPA